MKKILALLFAVCSSQFLPAQQLAYPAALIPDSLRRGADAVYRLEEAVYNIHSPSSMDFKLHTAVTILTKNGLAYSRIGIPVDKFSKLEEVEVKVYNELGLLVNRYKKKDFELEGMFSDATLASDDKVYRLIATVPGYPCTIETNYQIHYSSYIDIPAWFFGSSTSSVETSRFLVKVNNSLHIDHKSYNNAPKPVVQTEGEYTSYLWEIKQQPIPYTEPNTYGAFVHMPWIDVTPGVFSYDGFPGSLRSWNEFGKWSYPFYEETPPFTAERLNYLSTVLQGATSTREKVSRLHQLLQQETRYVSIQFGIGGFKPFPLQFVEAKKYGDCKALTHYMKALLQAFDIPSYPALINAGSKQYPVDPQFTSNKFNHVILCVPLKEDTMWLECTAKKNYPGFLGTFTENRYALLITENGGKLVPTPKSRAKDNQWRSHTEVKIDEDGSGLVDMKAFASGEIKDWFYSVSEGRSKDAIKQFVVDVLNFKVPDDLELKFLGSEHDGIRINLRLLYNNYFDFKAGSKHFLPLRPYRLNDETIEPSEKRKFDYLFDFPFEKTDTTVLRLPAIFQPESLPALQQLQHDAVHFKNEWKQLSDGVQLVTRYSLRQHHLPAARYNEVAQMFEKIRKDEQQKLVLKKMQP